jgi:spermidine/putrescine transport system substrate-binding protein
MQIDISAFRYEDYAQKGIEMSPASVLPSRSSEESYRRRTFLARAAGTAVAVSGAGAFLAACGSSSSDSTGGGGVGGNITMLSWEGYRGKGVVDPWLSKEGISITENLLASNEEVLTKLKAGGIGSVSLVTPNVAYIPQLVAADTLQPIDVDRIPNLEQLLPAIDRSARESAEIDGELYAIPYMWGFDGLVYNVDQLSAPKSWKDVLDPKYKDKVLMISGAFPNFEIWPRVLGFDPATLTQDQLDEVVDFLIELKKNQVRIVTGDQSQMAALLSSGDVWLTGSGCWVGLPSIAPEGGSELGFTMPPEGGGTTWIDTWAIPKDAPNIDTVYAYLNEMMSAPVQAKQADTLGMATSNEVAAKQVSKENRERYGYKNDEIGTELAPLFRFPEQDKGYTTSEDWNEAWNRIQAA